MKVTIGSRQLNLLLLLVAAVVETLQTDGAKGKTVQCSLLVFSKLLGVDVVYVRLAEQHTPQSFLTR